MEARQLDIYTTKAVVTHYSASLTYTLEHVAERTVFFDSGFRFLALSVSIDEQWTDSDSTPKPEVWIKGVTLLRDGTTGKRYVKQYYHEGHFSDNPRFQLIVKELIDAYYKNANAQIIASDSLGYVRAEYAEAN